MSQEPYAARNRTRLGVPRVFVAAFLALALALVACGDPGPGAGAEPVAAPGDDRTVIVGAQVTLDGRASEHADAFAWSFAELPAGSGAVLAAADASVASFVADAAGAYAVRLTVSNGRGSDEALVVISAVEGLLPDGVYRGSGGLVLAALPGALDAAIGVYSGVVEAPDVALPPEVDERWGPYLVLGSDVDTLGAAEAFAVALPVPDGADVERLALAVLLRPEDVSGLYLSDPTWWLVEGVFEPRERYFVAPLSGLAADGRIMTLVSSGDVFTPALGVAPSWVAPQQAIAFEASCRTFDDPQVNNLAIGCTAADEAELEAVMAADHVDLQGLGFRAPNLPRAIDFARTAVNVSTGDFSLVYGPYQVQLRPYRAVAQGADQWPCGISPNGASNGGGYTWRPAVSLFVCIDQDGLYDATGNPTGAVTTARHELFHAIQLAYPKVRDSSRGLELWVIEGTAVASENSSATMQRASRPARPVEISLWSEVGPSLPHYQAQDFFVFAGQSLGRGLDYLRLVFARGARTEDVDAALVALGVAGGLSEVYWQWVRHQAMADSSVASAACRPQSVAATPVRIDLDANAAAGRHTATLPSLTAQVVELTFAADPQATYVADLTVTPDRTGAARVKVYYGSTCAQADETTSLTITVEAGKPRSVVVLVANGTAEKAVRSLGFDLDYRVQPSVFIDTPDDGVQRFAVEPLPLRAVITGADPVVASLPIDWWVTATTPGRATTQWRFESASGETLFLRRFDAYCDATVDVEAIVDPGALVAEYGLLNALHRVTLKGEPPARPRAVIVAPTRRIHHLELREGAPGAFELPGFTLRGYAAQRRCGADGLPEATATWLDRDGQLLASGLFQVDHAVDPADFDNGSGGWAARWYYLEVEFGLDRVRSDTLLTPCYGREDDDGPRLGGVPPCPNEIDGFWYDLDQAFDTLMGLPSWQEVHFELVGLSRSLEDAFGLAVGGFPNRDPSVVDTLDVDIGVREALRDLAAAVSVRTVAEAETRLLELDARVRGDLAAVDATLYQVGLGLVWDALEAFRFAPEGADGGWARFAFVRDTDAALAEVDPVAPARGALQGFLTSATYRAPSNPIHLRAATLGALVYAAEELERAGY